MQRTSIIRQFEKLMQILYLEIFLICTELEINNPVERALLFRAKANFLYDRLWSESRGLCVLWVDL